MAVDKRRGLTPALPATTAFREYLFWITGFAGEDLKAKLADDPNSDRLVRAQQTWDRAFACRIANIAQKQDALIVIGIIGRGHLEYFYGTPFLCNHEQSLKRRAKRAKQSRVNQGGSIRCAQGLQRTVTMRVPTQ